MELEPAKRKYIEQAICRLLKEHGENPFLILREAGMVAELRARLLEKDSPFKEAVSARLNVQKAGSKLGPRFDHSRFTSIAVWPVQMEIAVNTALQTPEGLWKKRVDLAILSSSPELHLHKNGPGDVIQQLAPASVSVAFEIKASPSADEAARGSYVKDILSLLWLRRHYKIPGYFVLIDKSHSMYGAVRDGHECLPMRWDGEVEQKITVRLKSIVDGQQTRLSFAEWNLDISDVQPTDVDTIDVWMLDADGKVPRLRYASVVDWNAVGTAGSRHHWLAQVREE